MTDYTIELDKRRSMAEQKETEFRRLHLHEFQVAQAALLRRQEELEKLLLTSPAETWPEAAAKAQYLIQLFEVTPQARDPRRKQLIAHALEDLARLCAREKEDA